MSSACTHPKAVRMCRHQMLFAICFFCVPTCGIPQLCVEAPSTVLWLPLQLRCVVCGFVGCVESAACLHSFEVHKCAAPLGITGNVVL